MVKWGNFRFKVKKIFTDMQISNKILIFSFTILIFSVILSTIIYRNISNRTISDKVSSVSLQTLFSINSNIDSMIDNSKNLSKVIMSSDEIQQILKNKSTEFNNENSESPPESQNIITTDLDAQNTINTYISKFIEFPFISSIYIFDNNSQRYGIDKTPLKSLQYNNINKADWYDDAIEAEGGYILRLNAGNVFNDTFEQKYISLIRVINDIYTQKQIGILILNISFDSFAESFQEIIYEYDTDIMIMDGQENIILDFKNTAIKNDILDFIRSNEDNSKLISLNGQQHLTSYLDIPEYDWKIVSVMSFEEITRESNIFNITALIIIAFNGFLLFLGSIVVSRMISVPVNKLLDSMKGVENGKFERVDIESGNDEIGKLRNGYNIMIIEIENLIQKVVEDQRQLRKAELDVLQAQIKPHFLYNTFDAISSLALQGRNDEVYNMMQALGSYYRTSLSKGSKVITIAEEIEVVKNYLTIQKVRYGDIFTAHYDIDSSITENKILKLVLQPLVENSIYHGIKPKGEPGNIYILAKKKNENIVLTIGDDGVGMKQDLAIKILDDTNNNIEETGFGLRGTIERLNIFYQSRTLVDIESKPDEGTKIIITIPITKGSDDYE